MKLITPFFETLTPINGIEFLKQIELAARTSTMSIDEVTEDSYKKLIPHLLTKKHYSPFEFVNIAVRFTTSRAVLDELRTHRIGSHVMASTRYCNYSKDRYGNQLTFCAPDYLEEDNVAMSIWLYAMERAENDYFALLDSGWTPERARGVLPLDIASTMTTSFNLRQWREFFIQRTIKAAHSEFRRLSIPLLAEFKKEIPFVFDDIKP